MRQGDEVSLCIDGRTIPVRSSAQDTTHSLTFEPSPKRATQFRNLVVDVVSPPSGHVGRIRRTEFSKDSLVLPIRQPISRSRSTTAACHFGRFAGASIICRGGYPTSDIATQVLANKNFLHSVPDDSCATWQLARILLCLH